MVTSSDANGGPEHWAFLGLLVLLAVALISCSAKDSTPIETPQDCQTLYVILPGNFIIDLAAGSEVYLNPHVQQFVLFCSPKKAGQILAEELESGRLPRESDWKIFSLEGKFEDLARICGHEQFCLDSSAKVADWVE